MEEIPNIDESPELANWMKPIRFALDQSKDKLENMNLIKSLFSDLEQTRKNNGEG